MPISSERYTVALAAFAFAAMLAACGGKRPPVLATAPGEEPPASAGVETPPPAPLPEGPDIRPVEGEGAVASEFGPAAAFPDGEGGPLDDVLFAYDSAALDDAARAQLDRHAAWLNAHPDVRVTIEGHCDERGTVEYNLALGEQRAREARDYLVGRGVSGGRLRVVSYGKERPIDPAATEEAYARNRRDHFALSR
jgi:peptidoglycan-associated lipoprotein